MGLAELPDLEFMELLGAAGEEETVAGVPPVEGGGYTPEEIRGELQEAEGVEEDTPDYLA